MKISDPIADHLPQIDRMIQDLEIGNADSLYQLYGQLDQAFGTLYGIYVDELNYLAADEPQSGVTEKIGVKFAELQPVLSTLRDDLSLQDHGAALDSLYTLKEQASRLYELFASYQSVVEEQPKLSEIPYTHELVRVTRHYLQGKLSLEAVQGRFEAFCLYHESLETQLSMMVPSPHEREAYEQSREDLEEALNLQMQGMEDLDLALERQDREGMEEALTSLLDSAEVLVEVYRKLQSADLQPKTVSCIRCGAENSPDAKLCGTCAAVLPRSASVSGPNSTIALEEDGTRVGAQESEEIAKLQKAVDELFSSGNREALQRALESYSSKLQRSRRQFQKLEAPSADVPSEHQRLLSQARAVFGEALEHLERGLATLFQGAGSTDAFQLERGLEEMRTGAALFLDFQKTFQEAQRVTESR